MPYRKYAADCLTTENKRLYQIFYDMHKRCREGSRDAANYFDRGIRVCSEWFSWPQFCRWAHTSGYMEDLELDRIDNSLGYSAQNCRWSTEREQAVNRRDSRQITRLETGEVFDSQVQAGRITGINSNCIGEVARGNRKTAGGYHWAYI